MFISFLVGFAFSMTLAGILFLDRENFREMRRAEIRVRVKPARARTAPYDRAA